MYRYRRYYGAAFVQDDVKVSARFTVNLGLRWEYIGPSLDTAGTIGNASFALLRQAAIPPAVGHARRATRWRRTTTLAWSIPTPANRSARRPTAFWCGPRRASTRTARRATRSRRALGFAWQPAGRIGPRGGGRRLWLVLSDSAVQRKRRQRSAVHLAAVRAGIHQHRREQQSLQPSRSRFPTRPWASCRARRRRSSPTAWPGRNTGFPGSSSGT